MANTTIPIELSSTPGIVDNSNATAISIDSSENVGIGTASPASALHIDSATTSTTLTIESDISASLIKSGIDLIRSGTAKGSRIESLRDAGAGGVGFNFLTTADNAAEISGTLVSKMVILRSGNVGIGNTNPARTFMVNGQIEAADDAGSSRVLLRYQADGEGFSTANSAMLVGKNTGAGRSINCGGTVNASGADYAEYMKKADGCGTIAKGDVVGVDSDGKLTKTFSDAKSFVIKSTNPSYVGGDTWGNADLELTEEQTEIERQKYDRIAFSGQVPVNITGSFNVGDYVYPQANGTDIECVVKSNPTFEEYQLCVGKIWATEDDGRPLVAVKIG